MNALVAAAAKSIDQEMLGKERRAAAGLNAVLSPPPRGKQHCRLQAAEVSVVPGSSNTSTLHELREGQARRTFQLLSPPHPTVHYSF